MPDDRASIRIDAELLQDLGYALLSNKQASQLMRELYDTVELLVGSTVAQNLNEDQLSDFETYIDRHDDDGALLWLRANQPDYKQTVRRCFDAVCDELRTIAENQKAAEERGIGLSAEPGVNSEETNE